MNVDALHELIDRVSASVPQVRSRFDRAAAAQMERVRARGHTVSCRAGCSTCCSLPVQIGLAEAMVLADALDASQRDALAPVAARLRSLAEGGDVDAIGHRRALSVGPCPLLRDDHTCGAWRARPFACRGAFSTGDPSLCSPLAFEALRGDALFAQFKRVDVEIHLAPTTLLRHLAALGRLSRVEADRVIVESLGYSLQGDLVWLTWMVLQPGFWASLVVAAPRVFVERLADHGLWQEHLMRLTTSDAGS